MYVVPRIRHVVGMWLANGSSCPLVLGEEGSRRERKVGGASAGKARRWLGTVFLLLVLLHVLMWLLLGNFWYIGL